MDNDDYIHACQGMEESGGNFNQKLAQLYYVADSFNRVALRTMFHSHFEQGLEDYERNNRRKTAAEGR
jgi:hypothetical protein